MFHASILKRRNQYKIELAKGIWNLGILLQPRDRFIM